MTSNAPLFSAYFALLVSALIPIVCGTHASLRLSKASRRRLKEFDGKDDEEEQDGEEEEEDTERLTSYDALLFPLFGGLILSSLYLLFKYGNKELINRLFSLYFSFTSIFSMMRLVVHSMRRIIISETRYRGMNKWMISLSKNGEPQEQFKFDTLAIYSLAASIAFVGIQYFNPTWIAGNVIALSFAYNAISLLRLDTFYTGSCLLGGLFFYDVFFVFYTPIMMSVARDFDAPIKIVWPRNIAVMNSGFSLLGLGDIVLPGIFLALALRLDYHLAVHRSLITASRPPLPSSNFARPYFFSSLFAYIAGLTTTIIVMHTFQAAQPALLYLSSACISSVFLCALCRGEISELLSFNDASDDEEIPRKISEEVEEVALEEGELEEGATLMEDKKSQDRSSSRRKVVNETLTPRKSSRIINRPLLES